jgi:Protein of unknown function (DUF4058)
VTLANAALQCDLAATNGNWECIAMPVHDWRRVDAGLFHHFHQAWTLEISKALNRELLPAGYSALVEQHAQGVVPDVIAVERPARRSTEPSQYGGAVLVAPPNTRHVLRAEQELFVALANRVVVRHSLGRVVCVIKIVSPGNKSGRAALRTFVEKTADLLRSGVNLLIVDLFPPSPRDPQGIHKAVWDEIEEQTYFQPVEKPLTLAAYVSSVPKTAYVEPFAIGEALPAMPAYLDDTSYVLVPLEGTYQAAWDDCPVDMREIVQTL